MTSDPQSRSRKNGLTLKAETRSDTQRESRKNLSSERKTGSKAGKPNGLNIPR